MTLGGMALAVGILVDDATVEIENIHRNSARANALLQAILDGSQQIAVPAFVSTLCICIVFVPVVFISGAAKYLFTPLAMAVVFAMMTSYVLSRTLVPTLINYLLPAEMEMYGGHLDPNDPHVRGRISHQNVMWRFHDLFNGLFEKFRRIYGGMLAASPKHRALVSAGFALLVLVSLALFPLIGRDFFPTVDAGQIRLHVRTPPGTRIEETERSLARLSRSFAATFPPRKSTPSSTTWAFPTAASISALSDGTLMSPADGEIMVSLKPERHPTEHYIERPAAAICPRSFRTRPSFSSRPTS